MLLVKTFWSHEPSAHQALSDLSYCVFMYLVFRLGHLEFVRLFFRVFLLLFVLCLVASRLIKTRL